MASQLTETVVGGVVLAAAVGFAVYAGQVAGLRGDRANYSLMASFRSLEGVGVGTDIRLAGVLVGTVDTVTLNPKTYRADTVLQIEATTQIPDDSAVIVASEGLLGGNFIEIMPGGSAAYFNPGDTVVDTQGAVSLISLLLKFVGGQGEK